MKKIYFAENWGQNTKQIEETFKQQSPNISGVWKNICSTTNIKEADYLVIQDNCREDEARFFAPDKRLYFSREAMDSESIKKYPRDQYNHFSYWNDTGYLWTKWVYPGKNYNGIGKNYDELVEEKFDIDKKNKLLSCVQSNKRLTLGHKFRWFFLKKFVELYPDTLDLYGGIEFSNKELKDNNKKFALENYKFSLCFDNQDTIRDFFGTQFTDAVLSWTVPIYWGGADLQKYFPSKSFIKIDIKNPHEINRVIEMLRNEDYKERVEALTEARDLILNKYNLWSTISDIVEKNEILLKNR